MISMATRKISVVFMQPDGHRQQRQRRHRLQHAGGAQQQRACAGMRRGRHRQRHAQHGGQRHCRHHQADMLQRQPRQVGPQQAVDKALPRGRGAGAGAATAVFAHDGVEAQLVDLGTRIQPHHRRFVDRSGQRLQGAPGGRVALRQVQPVQQHRVVARKVRTVVDQHAQPAVADLRIGGVDVDGVDLAAGQRVVGQAMLQPLRALRQHIDARQPGPAVGAADKFVAQAQAQVRVARQVRQRSDAPLRGHLVAHGQSHNRC
jgi:hypothetical protein